MNPSSSPLRRLIPLRRLAAAIALTLAIFFHPGAVQAADVIDVNTASTSELIALPGIGEVKAAAIVSYREQNGPFTTVEQLDDVSGIGPATMAGIRPMVTIGDGVTVAPPESAGALRLRVEEVSARLGHRLRILVGKPGLDGHSNGAEQIALWARAAGIEVLYDGIRQSPTQIARGAVEGEVDDSSPGLPEIAKGFVAFKNTFSQLATLAEQFDTGRYGDMVTGFFKGALGTGMDEMAEELPEEQTLVYKTMQHIKMIGTGDSWGAATEGSPLVNYVMDKIQVAIHWLID